MRRSLPTGTQPPQVYQYSASDLPILQIGMSSPSISDTEIGDLANTVNAIGAENLILPTGGI